ncbi:MAG TPA: proton-conducting transporter membrane subunit [bacterium]|nr:proton-conducting transporter membrane subunit [bacterium]
MNTFFSAQGIYLAGALLALFLGGKRKLVGWVAFGAAALGTLLILTIVLGVFRGGPVSTGLPLLQIPGLGAALIYQIDYLSALFLAIIAIVSLLVTLYAQKFMQIAHYRSGSLRYFYSVLLVFFAAVLNVVVVADLFFFFVFWEIMTLTSYLMVIFRHEERARLRAGYKYFLITHVATIFLFIGGILLYRFSGSFSFSFLKIAMAEMQQSQPGLLHFILGCFFLGFATKAGILPMGDWLPDAYPAAPAPASAAFAGSMTKLGIYGLVRVFCGLLPISTHSQIWGLIIASFGAVSILVGTMTALVQDDAKRLLSFHVIGQMGYMFLAIGIGLHFIGTQPVIGMIGLGAGIFHLINHVSYKSCLFFNAGSVFYKTGTRDINKVGGLVRIMPVTAAATIIASLSIAGIPPFSGFASKWLIYQSALRGGFSEPFFILLALVAIFISAVTLASFIKFFGAIFFGKYTDNGSRAKSGDVPLAMRLPQNFLATLCILFGLVPQWPIGWIHRSIAYLFPAGSMPTAASTFGGGIIRGFSLNAAGSPAAWNALLLTIIFGLCALLAWGIFRAGGARQRTVATWYCGEELSDQDARYRAHGFYLPFKQLFRLRIGRYERPGIYPTIAWPKKLFRKEPAFNRVIDIDRWFYRPLAHSSMKLMRLFSATHSGAPHLYLLWLAAGAALALFILFTLSGGM